MSESKPVKIGITVNKSNATKTSDYYIMPPLSRENFGIRKGIKTLKKKSKKRIFL